MAVNYQEVSVIQWNARSLRARHEDSNLARLIDEIHPLILSISETWLRPDIFFRAYGYNILRKDRADGKGGVALLIHQSLVFQEIEISSENEHVEHIAAKIFLPGKLNLTVCSVYNPGHVLIPSSDWNHIFQQIENPFIIQGDFNAHSTLWGSNYTNRMGRELIDAIEDRLGIIMNDKSPTRVQRPDDQPSCVDLSISDSATFYKSVWRVLEEPFGSDHYPVQICLSTSNHVNLKPEDSLFIEAYKEKKADWTAFSDIVQEGVLETGFIEQCKYDQFTKLVLDAADQTIPKRKPFRPTRKKRRKLAPWWDQECEEQHTARQNAFRCFKKGNRRLDLLLNYLKEEALWRRLSKTKKREGWHEYTAQLNPSTPLKLVFEKIRNYKNNYQNSEHKFTKAPPEVLQSFLDKIAPPIDENVVQEDWINGPECDLPRDKAQLIEDFSITELKDIVGKLPETAPGKDLISFRMIKHVPENGIQALLSVMNNIWQVEEIPDSWRDNVVVPILKPGKKPLDSKAFRPIAKTNSLKKIMEHLIKNRLESYVESNHLLPEHQWGFRSGRSTLDSLVSFVTDLQISLSDNLASIAVFLDIEAAFDSVPHAKLIEKLYKLRLPRKIIKFIHLLTSERRIYVQDKSRLIGPKVTDRGVPQGSVLSPLLFALYLNDLYMNLTVHANISMYADDIVLYVTRKSVTEASFTTQQAVDDIIEGLEAKGLVTSPTKSKIMIFTRKRKIPITNVNIRIYDDPIPIVEETKFLGLVIDHKLRWTKHITYVEKKVEKRLNLLRSLCGVWWGGHPSTMLNLYKSLIRSQIEYGSILYLSVCHTSMSRIERLQNRALRICLGAMKTSPIESMRIEANEPPIEERRNLLADGYFLKVLSRNDHTNLAKIGSLVQQVYNTDYWRSKPNPPLLYSYSRLMEFDDNVYKLDMPLKYIIGNPIHKESVEGLIDTDTFKSFKDDSEGVKTSVINRRFQQILTDKWPNCNYIYTDGSKIASESGNYTGAAWYESATNESEQLRLNSEFSVFSSELIALRAAIRHLQDLANAPKTVIFSDSLSSLLALKTFRLHNKSNPHLCKLKTEIIDAMHSGIDLKFVWIPAHIAIEGNEQVDQLAKEAALNGISAPYLIPYTDIFTLSKSFIKEKIARVWALKVEAKQTQLSKIKTQIGKPWFQGIESPRRIITSIIRARIGHCKVNAHLNRMKITESPNCSTCGTLEDLEHILFDCKVISESDRRKFVSDLNQLEIYGPNKIFELLKLKKEGVFDILKNHIVRQNLKI